MILSWFKVWAHFWAGHLFYAFVVSYNISVLVLVTQMQIPLNETMHLSACMSVCVCGRAFRRNEGNFRKCIIVSFRCYLQCDLRCIQAQFTVSTHSGLFVFGRNYYLCWISYVLMFRLGFSMCRILHNIQ